MKKDDYKQEINKRQMEIERLAQEIIDIERQANTPNPEIVEHQKIMEQSFRVLWRWAQRVRAKGHQPGNRNLLKKIGVRFISMGEQMMKTLTPNTKNNGHPT